MFGFVIGVAIGLLVGVVMANHVWTTHRGRE